MGFERKGVKRGNFVKHKNNRIKVLPDKVFESIWKKSENYDDIAIFIKDMTNPMNNDYIDLYKSYNISIIKTHDILREIFRCSHLSFKDILEIINKPKIYISHAYMIPIRTIEDWYSGKNKCPVYIRLMLIKQYYILNFGYEIKLESELERKNYAPSYYLKHPKKEEVTKLEEHFEDIDDFIKKYSSNINMESIKEIEKSIETRKLLEKTDYLSKIMNRKQNESTQ